jgi:hypothetical protein
LARIYIELAECRCDTQPLPYCRYVAWIHNGYVSYRDRLHTKSLNEIVRLLHMRIEERVVLG